MIIIGSSLLIIPVREYVLYFTTVIPELQTEGTPASPYVQSFDGLFRRLFLNENEFTTPWFNNEILTVKGPLAIKIFLLFFTFFILYKRRNEKSCVNIEYIFLLIAMILGHNINWEYHYTLALLPAAVLYSEYDFFDLKKIRGSLVILLLFLTIGLQYPYDHKIFLSGPLILVTGIKLFALCGIYFFIVRLLILKRE